MVEIRKAKKEDIDFIEQIYLDIHTDEETGNCTTGWIRGIYPVRKTAEDALRRDDLFVMEDDAGIVGSAIINRVQVGEYKYGKWKKNIPDCKVTVLHTLVISPKAGKKGFGRKFVEFYENYAIKTGAPYLRMDTNARNMRARELYRSLGYKEVGEVPCDFNGIKSVIMVLLEKTLKID